MKRLIVMILLSSVLISSTVNAEPVQNHCTTIARKPKFASKRRKAYKYTLSANKAKNEPNYDEYRIYSSSQSVKVTDTDDLHIYNDNYGQDRSYGSKQSTDEFHTAPVDIEANDGYGKNDFDELHINENYRQNVWQPEEPVYRLSGFDEFRLPSDM